MQGAPRKILQAILYEAGGLLFVAPALALTIVTLLAMRLFDFLLFCQRNPKPCPLLDVTEPGDPEAKAVAAQPVT